MNDKYIFLSDSDHCFLKTQISESDCNEDKRFFWKEVPSRRASSLFTGDKD